MKELTERADIIALVNAFYSRVRQDELLAPIFNQAIPGDWELHLEKMYDFWETVLFAKVRYKGSPFLPHMKLPIERAHFERWLSLFEQSLVENFKGPKAEEALWRAQKMAEMFYNKILYYRSNSSKPLI